MSILSELIEAAKKSNAFENKQSAQDEIIEHVEGIGFKNINKDLLADIIEKHKNIVEKYGIDGSNKKDINKSIEEYYANLSYTVEITFQDIRNEKFIGCNYQLIWADGSISTAEYDWASRSTFVPVPCFLCRLYILNLVSQKDMSLSSHSIGRKERFDRHES